MDADSEARRRAAPSGPPDLKVMEALLEHSENTLVYLDRDLNFVRVNRAYAESCAKHPDELIGRNHFEFYPHAENEAIFARARDTGEPAIWREKPFVFPDMPERGVTYWDWTLTPIKNERDHVEGLVLSLSDVTDKVVARQQVEARERSSWGEKEWLRVTLSSIGDAVIVTDSQGKVTFMNAVAEQLTGWQPESALGKPLSEIFRIVNDHTGAPVENPAARAIVSGKAEGLANHTVLIARGGTRRPIDDSAAPIHDSEGKLLGSVLVFRDITQRKLAEEALRRSERRYRSFVEVTSQFAWVTDPQGLVVEDIPALRQFTGQSYEQAKAAGWADALHPDDVQRTFEVWNRAVATQTPYELEYRMRRHDGVYRVLLARGAPVRDEQCNVIEWVGTCIDITERKQAAERQLLVADILRVLNRTGDLQSRLADVLGLILKTSGFDAVGLRLRHGDDCPYFEQSGFSEEFVREEKFLCVRGGHGAVTRDAAGRPLLECTCGLVLSGQTVPAMSCFTEGGSFWTNVSRELLALPREADPRTNPRNRCIHVGYQSVGLFPIRAGQEIVGLLQLNDRREGTFTQELIQFYEGLAQSIGLGIQRVMAEDALREANARLSEADQRKDEFLAMLGHELRNPLAAIRTATEVIKATKLEEPRMGRAQGVLERQSSHMAQLIDGLLEVSQIARGKVRLDRKILELREVLEQVLQDRMGHAAKRGLDLARELPPAPVWVSGDQVRLVQIFDNLLGNAIKFTASPGSIRVCLREEDAVVLVTVLDTGTGIRPELISRMFEPFQQEVQDGARATGGLGLGLAVAKGLVELHGGTIQAHSAGPGTGAEFQVCLPRASAPSEVQEPAPRPQVPPQQFLLVEDNADAAMALQDLLELEGHQVSVVSSGAEAIQSLRQRTPDVVLCDIGLPGMSGYDVARAIKADASLRGTRLIALTGYGQPEDRQRSRQAGFDEHLTKPVDLEELIGMLKKTPRREPVVIKDKE